MPKTSKTKKKVTKTKIKKPNKTKELIKNLLKFQKIIFQKTLKNICAKNIKYILE